MCKLTSSAFLHKIVCRGIKKVHGSLRIIITGNWITYSDTPLLLLCDSISLSVHFVTTINWQFVTSHKQTEKVTCVDERASFFSLLNHGFIKQSIIECSMKWLPMTILVCCLILIQGLVQDPGNNFWLPTQEGRQALMRLVYSYVAWLVWWRVFKLRRLSNDS